MMNIDSAFPSRYLKAADVDGELTLTISGVEIGEVGQDENRESKPIVYFAEVEKGLVLNRTNASAISALFGSETDEWQGKRIALFVENVAYQGKQTPAIRVRKAKMALDKAESMTTPKGKLLKELDNVQLSQLSMMKAASAELREAAQVVLASRPADF